MQVQRFLHFGAFRRLGESMLVPQSRIAQNRHTRPETDSDNHGQRESPVTTMDRTSEGSVQEIASNEVYCGVGSPDGRHLRHVAVGCVRVHD